MDREESNENIITTTASSNTIHTGQRIVQNFLLIWVDDKIDQSKQDYQNTLTQLRNVVNDVKVFTRSDECIQFLNTIGNEKAFVIVTGSLSEDLVPEIHAMPQLDAVYILCEHKSQHEQWMKNWTKIKGVHTEITPICEALQLDTKHCNEDSIAVSFISANEGTSNQNLDQLEPSFMYTHIFKEILLEMQHDEQSIKNLAIYCRKLYNGNIGQLTIINEFEHDYRPHSSIWWYTRECFTYQMLNRALRTLEGDTIINMGFFIRDLHNQLEELHKKQVGSYHGKPFLLYRGQGLSTADFEKLVKTKGGLMSFNNFLSTSATREVSLGFAKGALTRTDTIGVLFQMCIDPFVSSAPFASIREDSYFQAEEEILFSMHSVFRIVEIKQIDNNSSLYQVDLKLTADDDQQLRILTERIREETADEKGWERLGALLVKIGQFDKAEELYKVLLEQTSDEREKGIYYNNLGYLKDDQGDYEKSIWYYEKALEIYQKTLPSNHPDLAKLYGNISVVYRNNGEYSKALSSVKKAIEIQEKTLPSNDASLATSYNNIGLVYYSQGQHSRALSFHEKALAIRQETLPPNHPDFAQSYSNTAAVYYDMGEYANALTYFERALDIWQRSLPPNHPDIQNAQENIEFVRKKL